MFLVRKNIVEKIKKKSKNFEFMRVIKLLYRYILIIKIVRLKGTKEENYLLKIIKIEKEDDIVITYTFYILLV